MLDKPLSESDGPSRLTPTRQPSLPDPRQPLRAEWFGSLPDRLTEPFDNFSEQIAVVDRYGQWTYADIDRVAWWVADRLTGSGIRQGDTVAIIADRASAVVSTLLGVMRLGAVFCLLDPGYPPARIRSCLRQVDPRATVLCSPHLSREYVESIQIPTTSSLLRVPATPTEMTGFGTNGSTNSHLPASVKPDDVAYIALTSGSTGAPRAILGTHRALSHFFAWYPRKFGFVPQDRFSGISGLGHDPFLRDIFTPLLIGARVCFPEEPQVGVDLARWMTEVGVTVMHGTPSHIALIARTASLVSREDPRRPHTLRYFLSGGDVLTTQMVQSLHEVAPDAHVVNLYGATETPQAIAYFDVGKRSQLTVGDGSGIIPLGQGIDGVQVLVLDPELKQVAPETEGEICIRTPYLAKSYLNEESLSAKKFVEDPFVSNSHARLYRTGDAGFARCDGVVVFTRRMGSAVKVRGFRVEPAEVERALLQCAAIRQAAVLVEQDVSQETRLVAYVTGRESYEKDSGSLRRELSTVLPSYMLPATFVWLEQLPLTPSGKIDREAVRRQARDAQMSPRAGSNPGTTTECALAKLWSELLGVPEVKRDDEFLSLGGSSILAAELFVRIEQQWGRRIPLASLFQNPSLATLAKVIDEPAGGREWLSLVPIQPHGTRPPLYCIHGLFGDVLTFGTLATSLGSDQPTFGVQARGLDGVQTPIESIEQMATIYIDELLAHNPEGPYQLLGFSSGGLVAYEMARQLTAKGRRVTFVGILDEPVHGAGPPQSGMDPKLLVENIAVNIPYWIESVVRMNWRQRLKLVRDRLRVSRRLASSLLRRPASNRVEASQRLLDHAMAEYMDFEDLAFVKSWPAFRHSLVSAHLRASAGYNPQPYSGNVTVFRARRQPLMQHFEWDLGWSKVVTGTTEVVVVKGSHRRIVEPQYIGELASHIAARLAGNVDTDREWRPTTGSRQQLLPVVPRST